MEWLLIVGALMAMCVGVGAGYVSAASARERKLYTAELVVLAAIGLIGFGLLKYYPEESWSGGVATGFFAIIVYDIMRKAVGIFV